MRMRTYNPALNTKVFQQAQGLATGDTMTLQGTINKSFIMLALVIMSAAWIWGKIIQPTPIFEGIEGVVPTIPPSIKPLIMSIISVICPVARGSTSGDNTPSACMSR